MVDAVNDDQTPRRYLVRKFSQNGTFQASYKLAPTGKLDPRVVDGMAFDRRGTPFFTYSDFDKDLYKNDNNDRTWYVLKLVTAAVLQEISICPRGAHYSARIAAGRQPIERLRTEGRQARLEQAEAALHERRVA